MDRRAEGGYRAPWWLPGGHLQTIVGGRALPAPRIAYRRELWDTPDGDRVAVDWVDGPPDAPLHALFHGLEGDSRSTYARALMAAVRDARGARGCVVHFRGCGGIANVLPRAYHSGDADEIAWMVARLAERAGPAGLFTVGVSLGGNALLKWLGRSGAEVPPVLRAAAAVCAPLDVRLCGDALGRGFNRLYTWYFLRTLKPKARAKLALAPGLFDGAALERATTLREFDDCYTAPVHGFRDADDYWTQASSRPWLRRIVVPTLVLNVRNDPFVPPASLPEAGELGAGVRFELLAAGGHVGFVTPPFPGSLAWLPRRVLGFLADASAGAPSPQRL
jgi:uncharacterized protein